MLSWLVAWTIWSGLHVISMPVVASPPPHGVYVPTVTSTASPVNCTEADARYVTAWPSWNGSPGRVIVPVEVSMSAVVNPLSSADSALTASSYVRTRRMRSGSIWSGSVTSPVTWPERRTPRT
jgi:hypothetical protein